MSLKEKNERFLGKGHVCEEATGGDCGNDSRSAGSEQLSGCLVQFNLVLEQARFMEFDFYPLGTLEYGC